MLNAILFFIMISLWGYGYIAMTGVLWNYTGLEGHCLRYFLAGLICLPFLIKFKTYKRDWEFIRLSMIAGLLLFSCMIFLIVGLSHTTIAKNSFISVLYVLFVPIFTMIIYRAHHGWYFWPLMCSALFGIFMMCDMKIDNINLGDMLTVVYSVIFAMHILYLDKVAKFVPSRFEFNLAQTFWVGVYSLFILPFLPHMIDLKPLFVNWRTDLFCISSLSSVIFLAWSSIVAFTIQLFLQTRIKPHILGMFFILESPTAALFGYIFLGEALTPLHIAGATVVCASVFSLSLCNIYLKHRKAHQKLAITP